MPQGNLDIGQLVGGLNEAFGWFGQPKREAADFAKKQADLKVMDSYAQKQGYKSAAEMSLDHERMLSLGKINAETAQTAATNQSTKESQMNVDKLGLPLGGFNAQTARMGTESTVKTDTTNRLTALQNLANDRAGRADVTKVGGTDFSTPEGMRAYATKGAVGAEKTSGTTGQAEALQRIMSSIGFLSPEQQQSTFKALESIGFPGAAQLLAPFRDQEAQKAATLEYLKRGGKGSSGGAVMTPPTTAPKPTGYIAPGSSGGPGGAPSSFMGGLIQPSGASKAQSGEKPSLLSGLAQLLQTQGGMQNVTNQPMQLDPALLQQLMAAPSPGQNSGYTNQVAPSNAFTAGDQETPLQMLQRLVNQNWPKP